ncbi:ABC transporter ATP-binding protein [Rossellomorea aquimaris]|jgi:iron complex transport system ATP-binding protein|uniref:ABC transporter ATP-binding protein n=1 Tax=Rossellomorea aquimaris TaxID=189382 RepID=A0A5D4URW1_9BACI|nr:ABC transporter ATP-binding protein [Rossellomorea aquimaris]TYS81468.1 ABC transporter ATP-binding protein [Rossellomorea aquimaris]TYS88091.1 ABC transporter ATP-binding protein [Rossellomorea aquimaris]TYS90192.1 ABC transporter ATP-binding protein [Rossellomorea aquimaris]
MIHIRGLSKFYGKKLVVEDVTVTIQPGQITSFIGPNGAGKSTLLSMVSRLLDSDSGEIILDQADLRKMNSDDLAKRVAILKQSNFLNVRLTVRELVSFGRFPYSKGRLTEDDERAVNQALDYMNLVDLEGNYLEELSGGQRQRAFIAMVIAQDTDYILLDEPLNNLDMKHSVQIMKILRRLVDDLGKTVVIVLHDINFASVYSDRIVAMKNGKVIREGSTDIIIQTQTLKEIYDMDIPVQQMNDNRICVYFNS